MWEDPIVKEIHKFREEHAKKFNFDLRAIFFDLKEQEKRGKRHVVSLPIKHRKGGTPNLKKNNYQGLTT
ncbi:MAG: hypothetical protein KAT34_02040 [Candidatus Aminicenantes bacterium]|nr:hypothetical protein [Candidatus Aminicenantes bacterium]